MKAILSFVGARPNFMKMASVHRAIEKSGRAKHVIVHTGQHFSPEMSADVFDDLGLPTPNHQLQISGGTGIGQVGHAILALEKVLADERPSMVLVYGDVNSTVAAAFCASRLGIKLAHVEAGLRSFDRTMPEELNRMMADSISDYAFVTEPSGKENLLREGWGEERIFHVGNTMIDSLVHILAKAKTSIQPNEKYLLITLHRPSNVDSPSSLARLLDMLGRLRSSYQIVFPLHPRTRASVEAAGLGDLLRPFQVVSPLRYSEFVALMKGASGVVTDSGGIQEETTYMGIPCITLRENTERPITLKVGTNTLVSPAQEKLGDVILKILQSPKAHRVPDHWDGRAGERILDICLDLI